LEDETDSEDLVELADTNAPELKMSGKVSIVFRYLGNTGSNNPGACAARMHSDNGCKNGKQVFSYYPKTGMCKCAKGNDGLTNTKPSNAANIYQAHFNAAPKQAPAPVDPKTLPVLKIKGRFPAGRGSKWVAYVAGNDPSACAKRMMRDKGCRNSMGVFGYNPF